MARLHLGGHAVRYCTYGENVSQQQQPLTKGGGPYTAACASGEPCMRPCRARCVRPALFPLPHGPGTSTRARRELRRESVWHAGTRQSRARLSSGILLWCTSTTYNPASTRPKVQVHRLSIVHRGVNVKAAVINFHWTSIRLQVMDYGPR